MMVGAWIIGGIICCVYLCEDDRPVIKRDDDEENENLINKNEREEKEDKEKRVFNLEMIIMKLMKPQRMINDYFATIIMAFPKFQFQKQLFKDFYLDDQKFTFFIF